MRSVNKVILIGNLTRDTELRQTPNGQNVVTFGLATNREWVTKDGRKENSAEYHDLVAWAKLADICHQYLKKGKLVYVEGYLKTRSWDTPEGVKKFRTEVVVQDMIMLDKRGESEDFVADDRDDREEEMHDDNNTVEAEAGDEKPEEKAAEPQAEANTQEPQQEQKEEKKEPVAAGAAAAAADGSIDIDSDLGL